MSSSDSAVTATLTFTVPSKLMLAIKSAAGPDSSAHEGSAANAQGVEPVGSTVRLASTGDFADVFAVMMEYLKMVSKEAREDRKVWRADHRLEWEAREAKLALDLSKIDHLKTEAAERFERAMCAATAELVLGRVATSAEGGLDNTAEHHPAIGKASDRIQLQIQHQEQEIDKAAKCAADSRAEYEAARDRKRRALDDIQKFLDILRSMNPQI